ncbi:MAG: hypothetical protein QHC90_25660 [Shinella sp.]|nr:hypothetical protein [Shinella sp.]
MIEYALLFALGFLAATLVGLLIAPAIQRRIVKFTETRIKATMPLSPQEMRAQKDMARAAFAAENARLSQNVVREREKGTRLMVQNERLLKDTGKLAAENADLQAQVAEMNVEAADLRSAIRRAEQTIEQFKTTSDAGDREGRRKLEEMQKLLGEVDDLKIALAARDTELENLKSRIDGMRDERDRLRGELKVSREQAREIQLRLSREEGRVRQLETKLSKEVAGSVDKDTVIERRIAEVNRLREKLKGAAADKKAPAAMPPLDHPSRESGRNAQAAPVDLQALEEDVRNQSAALAERLVAAKSDANDEALREEIADIARKMIVLTATREGTASPIHDLLESAEVPRRGGRKSLARRAKDALEPEGRS